MSIIDITNIRPAQQIVDDQGITWLYEDGKIRAPFADDDIGYDNNGYWCESFEDGVELLKAYDYISADPSPNPKLRAAYERYRREIGKV